MAATLVVWGGRRELDNAVREAAGPRATPHRALRFDLSRPVPGSGAVPRGVVLDSAGRFSVFWSHVPEKRVILNTVAVPVRDTVVTDRVEFWISAGGHQYVLQVGPWTMGHYSPRGTFHGDGTTRAIVERPAFSRWIVRSGPNSVGRLWLVDDVQRPVDQGLYYFDFAVQFDCAS
jgi:hypothetical protein